MRTFFFALSNNKNRFRCALSRQATRNRSGKIRRRSLMLSSQSAFMHLFNGGQDDALITMTGFDHANFNELLQYFSPLFHQYTPHVASGCNIQSLPVRNNLRGRIRTISPVIALALVLVWTRTRGSYAALQVIFRMTVSNFSKQLLFSKQVLLLALLWIEEAKNQNANNSLGQSFQRGDSGQVSFFGSLLGCFRWSKDWHSKAI